MQITIIDTKLVKNRFTLGTFPSQAQASEAARQIEPLLTGNARLVPKIIEVISKNGGK